ncbi:MAG: BatA domain-containing protein [Planctomycetes bacterium]|nr:BatA domain-containing protein [Planctomycetota bacterium]
MIGLERLALLGLIPVVPAVLWWLERARRRPRPHPVASLLLWRRVAAAGTASRRGVPALLLLLECLAGVALVVAAAGPFRVRPAPAAPAVSILVDRQPGMAAPGVHGRPRLVEGIEAVAAWLEPLPAGTRVRVLSVPAAPGGTREFEVGDRALAAWLEGLGPAVRGADLDDGVGALASLPGRRLVVTDRPRPASAVARNVDWLGVGAPGTNAGLVWGGAEASAGGPIGLRVGVLNGGTRAIRRPLVLEAGSSVTTVAVVTLGPGEVWSERDIAVPGGASGEVLVLRLQGGDDLAADDAVRFRPRPAGEVALVAEEAVPAAVQRAVRALGAEAVRVAPAAVGAIERPAVYWKVLPRADTAAPLVLVACPGDWNGIRFGGSYAPAGLERGEGWSEVGGRAPYPEAVSRALAVTAGDDWTVELRGRDPGREALPVVLRRGAAHVLAFDPVGEAPGWPARESFPAFFYRALGQVGETFEVEGLLSAADTTLGTDTSRPPPAAAGAPELPPTETEPLGGWLVVLALLALLGIGRLEV